VEDALKADADLLTKTSKDGSKIKLVYVGKY
jgi:hypothetical protein